MPQLIPKINSTILREQPDQFCATLNKVIEEINKLKKQ